MENYLEINKQKLLSALSTFYFSNTYNNEVLVLFNNGKVTVVSCNTGEVVRVSFEDAGVKDIPVAYFKLDKDVYNFLKVFKKEVYVSINFGSDATALHLKIDDAFFVLSDASEALTEVKPTPYSKLKKQFLFELEGSKECYKFINSFNKASVVTHTDSLYLSHVCLGISKDNLKVTGTNGVKLYSSDISLSGVEDLENPFIVTLDSKLASYFSKIKNINRIVFSTTVKSVVSFDFYSEDITYNFMFPIGDTFPDASKFFTLKEGVSFFVKQKDFSKAVKINQKSSSNKFVENKSLRIKVIQDCLSLSIDDYRVQSQCEFKVPFGVTIPEEFYRDFSALYDAKYLLDSINTFRDEFLEITLADNKKPIIIRGNFEALLLMPRKEEEEEKEDVDEFYDGY